MAGSYQHCVDNDGGLLRPAALRGMLDTPGDVWEAVEQMYGMIWFLAGGDLGQIEAAQVRWAEGIGMSPTVMEI